MRHSIQSIVRVHLTSYAFYFALTFAFLGAATVKSYCQTSAKASGNLSTFLAQPSKTQSWQVDKVHSKVGFAVTHLVISEVEGKFSVYDGSFTSSKADFSDAKISFSVDVNSINTDNETRDNHLKSDDFFNAEAFPLMRFTSTRFTKISGNRYRLMGKLSIRDITKPVEFEVRFGGIAENDGYGNTKAGFKAKTTINRFDYGLKWNSLTEAGGLTVGEEVDIDLNLQFALEK